MKDSIDHIKILLSNMEGSSEDKVIIKIADGKEEQDDNQGGSSKITRSNTRKMAFVAIDEAKQLKKEVERMDRLELQAAELLKNMG